jgi:protocatechuate 3,4-dioxygenase beta subunit
MVSRRGWLVGGGLLAGAGAAAYVFRDPIAVRLFTLTDNSAFEPSGLGVDETGRCTLTANAMEGPFYVNDAPLRSDVREDREGLHTRLRFRIVDAGTCMPIEGAKVAIWHADALGNYSAHDDLDPSAFPFGAPFWQQRPPATGSRYLRGHQLSDAQGLATFDTVFPGWYTPRTPHIHVRVIVGGRDAATTQLFFPQPLIDEIATAAPYASRGASPFTNTNDFVLARADGAPGAWPKTALADGMLDANLTIGIVRPAQG